MSQQAAETSDAYTVVVFRGSSSKPLRFSFPRKFVRKLLILAAILIVADLGVNETPNLGLASRIRGVRISQTRRRRSPRSGVGADK